MEQDGPVNDVSDLLDLSILGPRVLYHLLSHLLIMFICMMYAIPKKILVTF